jgi:DNA-binding NarL/FixJ family response regulator
VTGEPVPAGERIRIAVCDDARAVKFFLRQVLEEDGDMEVVSTTSGGREVLEALSEVQADILLLDLLLPDVPEPADLVRQIRERSPAIRILLMSNLPAPELEIEAGRLQTEGWTPKANKPEQLRNSVREIIAAAP